MADDERKQGNNKGRTPRKPSSDPGWLDRKQQYNLWYVVLAVFAVLLIQSVWTSYQTIEHLPYSQFRSLLEAGKVAEVTVTENEIRGRLREPIDGKELFVTQRVDPDFAAELERYNVEFAGARETTYATDPLSPIIPNLFFFALCMFVFRRIAERQRFGGLMNVGKSKAKVYVETETGVTFDDVAGVDEAKAELQEVVN